MSPVSNQGGKPPVDHEILNQSWFKSVGPRTYAAQLKKAGNGNHFLVLTEGKRDEKTGEVRKCRIFLYSEDFAAFFKMLHETAVFIRENPVPDAVKKRQDRMWAKRRGGEANPRPGTQSQERPPAPRLDGTPPAPTTRRPDHARSPGRQPTVASKAAAQSAR